MPSLTPTAIAGEAIGVGSIGSGLLNMFGAGKAASAQTGAATMGIATQVNELNNLLNLLKPYLGVGAKGADFLSSNAGSLTAPFAMTSDQLAQTPGYQFTLQQGEQGVANAYSGRGLGAGVTTGGTAMTPSGPGIKGAEQYTQELASTTFQQMFQDFLTQNAQRYSIGLGLSQVGSQAAATFGGIGQNAVNTVSGLQSSIGAANANAIASQFGAGANMLGGLGSAASNYALINALGGGSLGGGATGNLVDQAGASDLMQWS